LHEVFAHRVWYLEKKNPPNEAAATLFSRFYSDDTALRLYSAGEHLANGIIMMLEISEQEIEPYKQTRVSQQSAVGHFLLKERTGHPITTAIASLVNSRAWCTTIEYRNKWVHEQPPTIEGLGIVYKREKRWRKSSTGKSIMLGLGGGDEPKYSVNDLIAFVQPATFQFSDVLTSVIEFYVGLLESHGIRFNKDSS
jgi:hypothetical protein